MAGFGVHIWGLGVRNGRRADVQGEARPLMKRRRAFLHLADFSRVALQDGRGQGDRDRDR